MSNISTVEITVTALSSRVAALKKALTDEQLKVYEKTMLELKEKFIKNNPGYKKPLKSFDFQRFLIFRVVKKVAIYGISLKN